MAKDAMPIGGVVTTFQYKGFNNCTLLYESDSLVVITFQNKGFNNLKIVKEIYIV